MKASTNGLMLAYAAVCSYTLLAGGIIATIKVIEQNSPKAEVSETEPVDLLPAKATSKSQRAVQQHASIASECGDDWVCWAAKTGKR